MTFRALSARRLAHAAAVAGIVSAMMLSNQPALADGPAISVSFWTLPTTTLAAAQNVALPGSVTNDRKITLGGIGSDLWHGPNDRLNEFWMITDRGPNGQIRVGGANRRTFPVPAFDPLILKIALEGRTIRILQTIPIRGQSGAPVTGLSNLPALDEQPYDWSATQTFPFNPSGLDTEGIVRTRSGEFWLVDEYSPSILRLDAQGKVLARYIPAGLKLEGADYPVYDTLPGILALRKGNRGFEGIALSGDERMVYIVLQSPLGNPGRADGENSPNTRILAFSTQTGQPTAEYLYQFQEPAEFGAATIPDDRKLSSVVWVNPTTLLVNERTDADSKLFLADFSKATNILGTAWDTASSRPSLEQAAQPAGVTPMVKKLVIDLDSVPNMPDKIEGVAIVNERVIAVANDNDFGLGEFGPDGNLIDTGVPSQIILITLDAPLPLG